MSRFDLDAIAARLKRAGQVAPPPARPVVSPPVPVHGAPAEVPTPDHGETLPPPTSTRRPKRRRWPPPGSPAERNAEPIDPPPTLYRCPHCGERHQPVRMGGGGLADAYGQQVIAEPGQGRPAPLGREADETPLVLRRFRPWQP